MAAYIRWSKGAIGCYEIGCNCSICEVVPNWFKKKCKMKKAVIELVKLYGKPFEKMEDIIDDD